MEVTPLSIILVKSDSKGDRLLFRYPFNVSPQFQTSVAPARKTPYSIAYNGDDILQNAPPIVSNICFDQLYGISDDVLATLFAVKSELCNQKFELKVNDVRFVSHPTLVKVDGEDQKNTSYFRINIVFALHAQASYSIVKCYYELSKRIGVALLYEERRGGYLSNEMKLMEVTAAAQEHDQNGSVGGAVGGNNVTFDAILKDCTLAQFIKTIYHDLCTTGLLNVTLNDSVTLSFCLPQKAHQFHKKGVVVEPEAIDRCLHSLKPYHGMLLLVDPSELLDCVPPSGARMLLQLIEAYNPLKSLQNMASDADLMIENVYQLVGHLVYWAKATIIYPLCETNVYVIAPDAQLNKHSNLPEKFATKFPGMSLFEVISDFSLPTSIGHLTTPLQHPARQGRLAQMVLWMLQNHLLMQLHTYVQFIAAYDDDDEDPSGSCQSLDNIHQNEPTSEQPPQPKINICSSLPCTSSRPLAVPINRKHSLSEELFPDSLTLASTTSNTRPSSASHRSNRTTTSSTDNDESIASMEDEDKIKRLLSAFDECDRRAILKIPAASNPDDLALMVRLWQAGYFKGEHHLEEIMYFENLRRSQLLQLVDKFRDVLTIYETEDPAIASLYTVA